MRQNTLLLVQAHHITHILDIKLDKIKSSFTTIDPDGFLWFAYEIEKSFECFLITHTDHTLGTSDMQQSTDET